MEGQREKQIVKALKEKKTAEVLSLLKNLESLKIQSNNYRRTTPLLCVAVSEGNIEVVKELLKMGAETNVSGDSGMKPLHLSIKHGRIDIMKILLSHGDSAQSKTAAGDSALFMAVINKQPEIVEHLINIGAKLDEGSSFLYSHNMPIHEAAKLNDVTILNLLLSTKPNVNLMNDEKRTALHLAAALGNTKNVQRLIQCGAMVDLLDSSNKTAIQLACENNHVQVVRDLCVAGASLSSRDGQQDPLYLAVSKRYISVVRTLLQFGADVNKVFPAGITALHLSIGGCRHKMRERWSGPRISVNSEIEMLDTLLQAGANVNHVSNDGDSPLHRCVSHGCEVVLHYLLSSGADYNQVNACGHTPLQLACSYNVTPAIQLLIKNCPGLINHSNHCELDKTPLIMLWQKRNLESLKLLFDAGYQATNAEKDHVEMMPRSDRKKVDSVITHYVTQEFTNPWKLGRICRTLIRQKLEQDLTRKVRYLPIPELLRRSLLMIT